MEKKRIHFVAFLGLRRRSYDPLPVWWRHWWSTEICECRKDDAEEKGQGECDKTCWEKEEENIYWKFLHITITNYVNQISRPYYTSMCIWKSLTWSWANFRLFTKGPSKNFAYFEIGQKLHKNIILILSPLSKILNTHGIHYDLMIWRVNIKGFCCEKVPYVIKVHFWLDQAWLSINDYCFVAIEQIWNFIQK